MTSRHPIKEQDGPDDPSRGRTLGDFRILGEIGRGGMGVVYDAEQVSLKRRVALKVLSSHLGLSDEAVRKFRREAEAGGRQRHPGIVAIYAVGEAEGVHYIAEELVEGGRTLADKVEEHCGKGEQPVGYFREAAGLIAEVADALGHAHASGVIHRDVKPSNILLAEDGSPRVTDFGLARVEDELSLTRTGGMAGTPFYMSPEQAEGKGAADLDHRTDIFSLGATLYEMLTLKRPFEGKTSLEVLKKVALSEPSDPRKLNPRVPRDLAVICQKALEKKPSSRYAAMADFAMDLRRFLSGEVILARPAGAMTKLMKRVKRHPALSTAVGAASLAVLAFIVYGISSYAELVTERNRALRLSDVKELNDLEEEAENRLWPTHPEKIKEMNNWLKKADELAKRLAIHEKTLETLRAEVPPAVMEVRVAGSWKLANVELRWQIDTLEKLVVGLKDLSDVTIHDVKKRKAFAETVNEESIGKHKEEWDLAIASIANPEECPLYNGLHLKPQLGLIPIERDPESRLWEFLHLQTGNGKVSERGADGRLRITEATGLVFVLIPGGKFDMGSMPPDDDHPEGSPNVDPFSSKNEQPVHGVKVEPFFFSKYEMTQGQWERFTGENPSQYLAGKKYGGKLYNLLHPVECVGWDDCVRELDRLGLRLPSEAEWEYAVRAGKTTIWWTGNDMESLAGEKPELGAINMADCNFVQCSGFPYDWRYAKWLDDGYAFTAPIGTYRPNPFGLHNIVGNVVEWCQDRAHMSFEGAPQDGTAWEVGDDSRRVFRGSCWVRDINYARSAHRDLWTPKFRHGTIGVRPARELE